MAVVSVERIWPGRDGSDDIQKRTEFTDVYEVITDDITDDQTVAGGTSLLPRLADAHENYPDALVVGVAPRQLDESPFMWHVSIRYSTEMPTQSAASGSGFPLGPGPESQGIDSDGNPTDNPSPAERPQNPLNRPAVWRRHTVEVEVPFEFEPSFGPDDPVAVLNSAQMPFDPPPMTKRRDLVLTIIKNVRGISNSQIDTYLDTINNATWKGIAIGKARVIDFQTASEMENRIVFTQVTVVIQITKRPWGWERRLVDRGRYEYIEEFGSFRWQRITTSMGTMDGEPVLLDGAGRKLTAGNPAVVLSYAEFGYSNFNNLMTLLGIP